MALATTQMNNPTVRLSFAPILPAEFIRVGPHCSGLIVRAIENREQVVAYSGPRLAQGTVAKGRVG